MRAPFLATVSALAACASQVSPTVQATGVEEGGGGGGGGSTGAGVGGSAGTGGDTSASGGTGTGGNASAGASVGGSAGAGGSSSAGGSSLAGAGGGSSGTSAGAGGVNPSTCPAAPPTAGATCEPAGGQTCTYANGACSEQFDCVLPGHWEPIPTPAGGACCPKGLPSMGDACPAVGVLCDYTTKQGGCPGGYGSVGMCGPFGWYLSPRSGGCNPPPPCPMQEPTAASACPPGTFAGQHFQGVCRYERGSCFTYWSCSADTYVWQSENGMGDGCCGVSEPPAASSCPTPGSACTYGDDLATCGADGWAISMLPVGSGGSAGSAGSAGSGGGSAGGGAPGGGGAGGS